MARKIRNQLPSIKVNTSLSPTIYFLVVVPTKYYALNVKNSTERAPTADFVPTLRKKMKIGLAVIE